MQKFFISFIFLIFSNFVIAQTYTAKIIGVKDGDTVEILLPEHIRQTVRLAHVDTPEKNQPYGQQAKKFVSDFCFGKTVQVVIAGKPDRNGRWIAEIFHQNKNLGKELVRNGLAWHYKKYSKNTNYAELETAARNRKKGLWIERNPVEPWNWRNYKKKQPLRKAS